MKFFVAIFIIFLLSCKSGQQGSLIDDYSSDYPLPTEKEINVDYKVYVENIAYYFSSKDTLNPLSEFRNRIPCRTIGYDENEKAKEVKYNWYESIVPSTSLSIHDSSGNLIEYYYKNDDTTESERAIKTLYYYDKQNKLSKTISFDFEKRLRKDVDKGLGRPGGCIIYPEDYEKHKSWALSSVWDYKYDDSGRLVEKIAPICNSSQSRYTYKYDVKGRLIEERSLDNDRLIWIESYTYYDDGHEYTRTWYENGQRRKNYNGQFKPIDTFRYKTDKFGNETDEKTIEEGGGKLVDIKNFMIIKTG